MRVRERDAGGVRCPFCREGIGTEVAPCGGCGVRLHPACAAELGRCATIGCALAPPPQAHQAGEVELEALRHAEPRLTWLVLGLAMLVGGWLFAGVARGVGATILPVLLFAALGAFKVFAHVRAVRFRGARLLVQPSPARVGQPVGLTLVVPPALRALAFAGPLSLRAELRHVRRRAPPHVAPGEARGEQRPGHVGWRTAAFANADVLRGERVTFEFVTPLRASPGYAWELVATCEVPGPDFEATWDVPFADDAGPS